MKDDVLIIKYNQETDMPNICFLKGDTKSLLIDCGGGPKMAKCIKNKIIIDPDYILLTHYHWDHSFGASYYKSNVLSSAFTYNKLKEHKDICINNIDDIISDNLEPLFCKPHLELEYDNIKELNIKLPDEIIESKTLDLGNRIIDIYSVVSPHTEGSLIAYDRNSKYLFIGDADCGYIKGIDFYNDSLKLYKFLNFIINIPFKYIVKGHDDIKT
ncbi:MAG: MBL fold metallo-hydrolase, partial [Acholeplasmatales bacterium]|nr:MBL fold metallo-hydrolase [Acholeplasmatales bacterium]